MAHEAGGEPDDVQALYAAIDDAVAPPDPLEWDQVLRAVWFGAARDPDAPIPRDIVDQAPPRRPDDHSSD